MSNTKDLCSKTVAETYNPLTPPERIECMKELRTSLIGYEHTILAKAPVRHTIYKMYNQKVKDGYSLAKFSRRFNMSVKGGNKKLSEHVETTMKRAFQAETSGSAAYYLSGLELTYELLMSDEVIEVLKNNVKEGSGYFKALAYLDKIRAAQDKLVASVIKMAYNLALKRSEKIPHNILTHEDMFHEAVLAAKRGVKAYRPNGYDTAEEAASAFPTYMYVWIRGMLAKYETENSRTVKLPRTVIDRWRPVGKAMNKLDGGSYSDIAALATKMLYDKRQDTRGNKLSRHEVYTEEEVCNLISAVQETVSLDLETTVDDQLPSTIVELMAADMPSTEDIVDRFRLNRKITELFQEYCAPDDFLLMSLRWGMGEVLGMQETANRFEQYTGRRIPKSRISTIERALFQKLKQDERAQDLFELIK